MADQLDADARQAAKAAAAAAAVGAAVGVARALSARADEAARRDRDGDDDAQAEDNATPEDVSDPHDGMPEPEEDVPRKGVAGDRLRRMTEHARDVVQDLTGATVESVSGLDQTANGWRVSVEALEIRRIPESTDVLATYDVEVDPDGDLVRFERRRRYARAQSDHGDDR